MCAAHGAQWHAELKAAEGSMRLLGKQRRADHHAYTALGAHQGCAMGQLRSRTHAGAAAELSSVQQELLNLHITLYNATGKLTWFSDSHPARLVERSTAVANAVARVKPSCAFRPHQTTRAEGCLATRRFSYGASPDQSTTPVLMPLIDLLNHHPQGAPFRIRDGAMRMQIAQSDVNECFAHYGHRRDVLDLALHYGYSELHTTFAHCAPLEIHVDGIA